MTEDLIKLKGQKPSSIYDFIKLRADEFTQDGSRVERSVRRSLGGSAMTEAYQGKLALE